MGNEKETQEPIEQSVHVDCSVDDAFRLFTERFGDWWPGEDSERAAIERGTVTLWDPPRRIRFTWRRDHDQTVTADFHVEADGTRVTVIHTGWQHAGAACCLACFAQCASGQMLVAV